MTSDQKKDILGQVKDAEDAITGLRPEDAMTHLITIEHLLADIIPEDENTSDYEGPGVAGTFCGGAYS